MIQVFLIGVGLSMDAFAVSVCRGLSLRRPSPGEYLAVGLWFGGFQALMPLLGYRLGTEFGRHIDGVDHILACLILGLIGANMIREGLSRPDVKASADAGTPRSAAPTQTAASPLSLFLLAVATSVDAFAVGISFGVMGNVRIGSAACLIGATTATLSAAGLKIGSLFGAKLKSKAEITGGALLVLIGLKILAEGFL